MKKILLPTDFSANAWNAITYALALFREEECQFFLLNTYMPALYRVDYAMGGPAYSGIPDPNVENSLTGLENTVKDIQRQYGNPKHSFETLSAFNLLTDEIQDVVARKAIDFVVMGTQGATGAEKILFGSNTVFTMRKADVPILAIPEHYRFKPIDNVLFPTDYLTRYKVDELSPLFSLLRLHKAKLTILHFVEDQDMTVSQTEHMQFLNECFEGIDHTFKNVHHQFMPNAIHDYIDTHDFDMVVMMNRKHSFLERLLLRQNVDSIGFDVKIPFLALRDTAQIIK